jgi:emfourin
MKLRLIQSGGLLGIVRSCEVDTARLGREAADELERMVRASGISASGTHLSESARDLHTYEITIEDGDRTVTVVFDDANMPAAAKPMIGYLKQQARPVPPG